MKTFKNYALAEAGFVILASALVLMDPHAGYAAQAPSPANVTVVNTTANPVPTTVQGPVTIQGTVPVSIAGTVATTTTVQGTVQTAVQGTVPVRDVDNPAKQPIQVPLGVELDPDVFFGGGNPASSTYDVPAGKRFVIEHVSVLGTLTSPDQLVLVTIQTTVNGITADHDFGPQDRGQQNVTGEPVHFWLASQQTRLYADPGTTIKLIGFRNDATAGANIGARLSGYLVDVP